MTRKITLEQQAFMKNLIMTSYRRKRTGFYLNLFIFFISFCVVYIITSSSFYKSTESLFESVILLISALIVVISFFRLVLVYTSIIDNVSFYKEKKNRLETLSQHLNGGSSFEDLRSCVRFREFFQI